MTWIWIVIAVLLLLYVIDVLAIVNYASLCRDIKLPMRYIVVVPGLAISSALRCAAERKSVRILVFLVAEFSVICIVTAQILSCVLEAYRVQCAKKTYCKEVIARGAEQVEQFAVAFAT